MCSSNADSEMLIDPVEPESARRNPDRMTVSGRAMSSPDNPHYRSWRWMRPRFNVYRPADRRSRVLLNRYPDAVIGVAAVAFGRCWGVRWKHGWDGLNPPYRTIVANPPCRCVLDHTDSCCPVICESCENDDHGHCEERWASWCDCECNLLKWAES